MHEPPTQAPLDIEAERVRGSVRENLFGVPEQPQRVGKFVVLERVGAGGMGVVYSAYDTELDRKIAIKLLHLDEFGGGSTDSVADMRMLREAQAMARLSHPNVVQIYEVGHHGNQIFLAMEFVAGKNLAEWLDAQQPGATWREVVEKFVQAGRGLAEAHRAGLIHRDFKPANVLVDKDGRVCVTDFGTVRLGGWDEQVQLDEETKVEGNGKPAVTQNLKGSSRDPRTMLTASGAAVGTVAYMSPEQFESKGVTDRSDQFNFFASMYEALYGVRPFAGDTVKAILDSLSRGELTPAVPGRKVPGWLRKIVTRGLSHDPAKRFGSMEEIVGLLERGAGRRRLAVVGAAVAATAAAAVPWVVMAEEPCPEPDGFEDVWSEERQEEIAGVFRGAGVPFGEAVWGTTKKAIDRYVEGWRGESVAACVATHVERGQSTELLDLRYACLQEQGNEVRALVGKLVTADAGDVENAAQATAELPSPKMCSNAEVLLRGIDPPSPDQQQGVEEVRELLNEGVALTRLGKPKPGLAVIERAVALAEDGDYAPVRAEALYRNGVALARLERTNDAVSVLRESIDLAESTRHDLLTADAWNEVSAVLTSGERLAKDARSASRRAVAAAKRVEDHGVRTAKTHTVLADILVWEGRIEEAEAAARLAVQGHEAVLGVSDSQLRLAGALKQLADVLDDAGKPKDALASYERALDIRVRELGESHPDVARVRYNMGLVLGFALGELEAARLHMGEALRIFKVTMGADSSLVAATYQIMAEIERLGADLEKADHYARLALEKYRVLLPSGHSKLIEPLSTLAAIDVMQSRFRDAEVLYREILEIGKGAGLQGSADYANALGNLGECLVGLGDHAEADHALREAISSLEQIRGPDHRDVAYPLRSLGRLHLAQGQVDAAIALLTRALELWERLPAADKTESALVRWALAQALIGADRNIGRALSLAREAEQAFRAAGANWEKDASDVRKFVSHHARRIGNVKESQSTEP